MWNRRIVRVSRSLVIIASMLARGARAELAAWDQAQVTELSKQLAAATDALSDTFLKQPPPSLGSMQSQAYYRLKQWVRLLEVQARTLADSTQKGEGREPTLPMYENLMQLVRSAREDAPRAFVGSLHARAAIGSALLRSPSPRSIS